MIEQENIDIKSNKKNVKLKYKDIKNKKDKKCAK